MPGTQSAQDDTSEEPCQRLIRLCVTPEHYGVLEGTIDYKSHQDRIRRILKRTRCQLCQEIPRHFKIHGVTESNGIKLQIILDSTLFSMHKRMRASDYAGAFTWFQGNKECQITRRELDVPKGTVLYTGRCEKLHKISGIQVLESLWGFTLHKLQGQLEHVGNNWREYRRLSCVINR